MTTETAIEQGTPHRFTAEDMARLRQKSCAGRFRWLARLVRFGEQVWCEHAAPFGSPGPSIVEILPEAGPSLAESAVGVCVNFAQRPSDGMRGGSGSGGEPVLKTLDLRVACGYIERAWVDPWGVVGVVGLWLESVHEDLRRLEHLDALAAAQICLAFTADFRFSRGPWQLPVFRVVGGRAFSATFTSLTHALGSRVVRPLALDEEPAEDEIVPADMHALPRPGLPAKANIADILNQVPAVSTGDITPGAVTNSVVHTGTGGASTTSGTEADISGETVTLTISASGSVVLITWNATAALNNNDLVNLVTVAATFKLYRGSTQIYRTDISMPVIQNSGIFVPMSMQFQDTGNVGSKWSM